MLRFTDRVARVLIVLKLAREFFGSEKQAVEWIKRPLAELKQECPLNVLGTQPGYDRVKDTLLRARRGDGMRLYMLVSDTGGQPRNDLDGMGGAVAGGRWSPRGKPAIYTSCHTSTALLELLVHTGGMLPAAGRLHLITLEIPDDCYDSAYVPAPPLGWGELERDPRATVVIGTRWLAAQEQLAMRVPSALSPLDFNVLLNPRHKDMATVEVVSKVPFLVDSQAFSGLA